MKTSAKTDIVNYVLGLFATAVLLVAVTNFSLVVRTAELAAQVVWRFDRTDIVFCGRIAML